MRTHNICFHGEIRKKLFIWILLSGAIIAIALDKVLFFFQPKSIYIFPISRRKHILWVLIRSASQHMFSSRNKKTLMRTRNLCFCREIRKLLT